MSTRIIDLIQENKTRFYRGEIRNCFYEKSSRTREKRDNLILIDKASIITDQASMWHNLKSFGQKFSENLFYEPAK